LGSALVFILLGVSALGSTGRTLAPHFSLSTNAKTPTTAAEDTPEDCACGTTSERPCHPWHILNLIFSYDAARFVRDEVRRSWVSRWPVAASRCALANATRGAPAPNRILTLFVLGDPHPELAEKVAAEAREFGDMLFLRGDEGWDRGRTFAAYRAVFARYSFEILGKVDDDSFIHVPNLLAALDDAQRRAGSGREWLWGMRCRVPSTDFVCGEAFWMSRGVAEFLATSNTVDAYRIGAEDRQTTLAIRKGVALGELPRFTEQLVEGGTQFIDILGAKHGAATMQRPFNAKDNVCVHQVKTANDWKRCRDFFFPSSTAMELGIDDLGALFVIRDIAGPIAGAASFAQIRKMLTRVGIPLPDERVIVATSAETLLGLCQAGKINRIWDTRADMSLACRLPQTLSPVTITAATIGANASLAAVALRHTHTRVMQVIVETKLDKPVVVLDSRLDLDRDFANRVSDDLAAMLEGWDLLCLAGCETDQETDGTSRVVQATTQGFAPAYVLSGWHAAEKMLSVLDKPNILVPMEADLATLPATEFHAYTLTNPVACLPDPASGICDTPLRKSMLATNKV